MASVILYALATSSLFYLGSRAIVTQWLWSRYPQKLARWADCAACSGAWYGAAVGYVGGYHLDLSFLGLDGAHPVTVIAIALCAMTWTPIVAGLTQHGFDVLGTIALEEDE